MTEVVRLPSSGFRSQSPLRRAATERSRVEYLRGLLIAAVAGLLGMEPALVDPDRPLIELGVSSREAMTLLGELQEHLGRQIDPMTIWRAPTITALSERLARQQPAVASAGAPAVTPAVAPSPGPAGTTAAHQVAEPADVTVAAPDVPEEDSQEEDSQEEDSQEEDSQEEDSQEEDGQDPVAVVGLGCRLPGGVNGPEAFWQQLIGARDSVGEVPAGRWEQFDAGHAETGIAQAPRTGGFLDDLAGFDAGQFGISPREAQLMDPQQRILLEVTWEALAHAGISPQTLSGTATGVWIGMSTNEYSRLTMTDLSRIDAWSSTGSALSIAANRLSYLLDLRGPSITLDSACSSSLVAVQQAVRAILAGDVDTALVGGTNLLLTPAVTISFERAGVLAADGRCKPFSAQADGIGRAEAVGVVVLKRLSRALADGDRVLAVIRSAAVNSDGRSNGITAPNPAAQEDLLRQAYAVARLDPATVDYVEAHGTGTPLGDPVEAGALGAVLGAGRRPGRPLLIGSVKSNLGHAEAAAGVVALIKVVLALRHGLIPASLHASRPSAGIPFQEWNLDLVTRLRTWPRYDGVARAGISAFGFGGTNAHVVLEEWTSPRDTSNGTTGAVERAARKEAGSSEDDVVTLVLSGTDAGRIRDQAAGLADHLSRPAARSGELLLDLAHTLARRWQPGTCRTVLAGRGRRALIERLRLLAESPAGPPVGVVEHFAAGPAGTESDAVWVFSGYGSHWPGMGARLLVDEPAFAGAVDELTPLLRAATGLDLRLLIEAAGDAATTPGVADLQVAIFGVQIALARLWQAHGHRPAAVIGHSLGEVAAAVVCGALSLPDGVQVIATRSRLLERAATLAGEVGGMAVLDLSDTEFAALEASYPGLGIAVHTAPAQCTVAGPAHQISALAKHVERLGRNAWILTVPGAGHSPVVDPVLAELTERLAGLRPGPARTPVYGTVLDDPRRPASFDGGYWAQNARRPVLFAQAVAAAVDDGFRTFVEISPHPVTAAAIRATLAQAGVQGTVLGTLRRRTDDTVTFRTNLAGLATAPGYRPAGLAGPAAAGGSPGVTDDLPRGCAPDGLGIALGRHAQLPPLVWRHTRHWMPATRPEPSPARQGRRHRLLGPGVRLPGDGAYAFAADLGLDTLPWLGDHQVRGAAVLPAAAYAEIGLAAGAVLFEMQADGTAPGELELGELELGELELHRLLTLGPSRPVTVITGCRRDGAVQVDVHAAEAGELVRYATMTVRRITGPTGRMQPHLVLAESDSLITAGRAAPLDVYAGFAAAGQHYGPAFSGITEAYLRSDDADRGSVVTARVALPAQAGAAEGFTVHPALLDACLQALAPAAAQLLIARAGPPVAHLPCAIGSLRVSADPNGGGWCEASVRPVQQDPGRDVSGRDGAGRDGSGWDGSGWDGAGLIGRIRLRSDDGTELLSADDILLRPYPSAAASPGAVPSPVQRLALEWRSADLPTTATEGAPGSAGGPTDGSIDGSAAWLVAGAGDLAVALARQLGAAVRHCPELSDVSAEACQIAGSARDLGAVLVADLTTQQTDPGCGPLRSGVGLVSDLADAIRALMQLGSRVKRVWIVTQGGATIGNTVGEPALAALRALVRVLAFEHPALRCTLLDVDPVVIPAPLPHPGQSAQHLPAELRAGRDDDEVAWRDGHRWVRRLVPLDPATENRGEATVSQHLLRPGGYLITGGLGGLGLVVAGRLAERGATRIVLAGRSADPDLHAEPIRRLAASGAQIVVLPADVSDAGDVRRMVAAATRDGLPLRGVVHAAGVLDDELFTDLSLPALQRVWAPKVLGGWNLHQATKDLDLDLWCVFSSVAALLGSPGQAAYATANAWLDALVEVRRSQGLPGVSIGWGAWSGAGGADLAGNSLLEAITVAEGLHALDEVLAAGRHHTGIVRLDVDRMAALLPEAAARPFFAEIRSGRRNATQNAFTARALVDDWIGAQALQAMDPPAARRLLADRLTHRVSVILGYRPEQLDRRAALTSLGVDSLMAVRAKNAVESDFGVALPVRLLLQGASLADLEQYLIDQLNPAGAGFVAKNGTATALTPDQRVIGPRDTTERWLVSLWKQALGHNGFGVTTALGPLIARAEPGVGAAVAAELISRLGADLDVEPVVCAGTVEQQADLIRDRLEGAAIQSGPVKGANLGRRPAEASPLRVLRAGRRSSLPGDDPALFLFHPAGGSTSVYHPMLSLMPTDLPVYGLDRVESATTIEQKAQRYLELIRRVRPHGPYRLGGWSLGGALAYEVAGRLTAAGDDVDLVVLIDSILLARSSTEDEQKALQDRFIRFIQHVRDTYDVQLPLDVEAVLHLSEAAQVEAITAALGTALPGVGGALLEHQRTSYVDARVAEKYQAMPYSGRVLLYRATEVGLTSSLDPRYARTDLTLGWDRLCPRLEVVRVPGDHTSIIDRPEVDVIAAHLSQVLGDLAGSARTPAVEGR